MPDGSDYDRNSCVGLWEEAHFVLELWEPLRRPKEWIYVDLVDLLSKSLMTDQFQIDR